MVSLNNEFVEPGHYWVFLLWPSNCTSNDSQLKLWLTFCSLIHSKRRLQQG